jgi:primosomal protein N' (replication factor Y)
MSVTNSKRNELYALICIDVIHPDVDRLFHYTVPPEMAGLIKKGMKVRVPFGAGNKLTVGYVIDFSGDSGGIPPEKIKPVLEINGDYVLFTEETLALAVWMREKYYAPLAACLRCVLPPGRPVKKPRKVKDEKPVKITEPPVLTGGQQIVVNRILARMDTGEKSPVLLHGVTGSGKTEVYLRAIARTLAMGKDAIVLVPEIALTPQAVSVFTGRFGDAVAVTHSRLSDGERFRIWKRALDGEVRVIIGPRSAVFAPFYNLGIIIIDEEHEHTYQSELSPKYVTREVAIKRAAYNNGFVIMGSATPCLESYYKAEQKEYILEKLGNRVNMTFPEVIVADMRKELAGGNPSLFANAFKEAMGEVLNAGEQIILFLNRRGHSSFVSCRWCGHVLSCEHCRVNYTYHANNNLLCHYCGRGTVTPAACPACGSEYIRFFGAGTQKVEAEMARMFPDAVCLRMDMDTTRGKHGHAKILDIFRKREAQVLIGTQMVAKGLDFPYVTLVGVVAADMSLFTGDFRSAEHTFQLLTQVAGRAGRADRVGRVFFQTYNPEHYSLILARQNDYEAFYRHEIILRQSMGYPPFSHVFCVLFTGPDEKRVIQSLHKLLAVMKYCNRNGQFDLMGISPAFVSKIKQQYRWKLLVKAENEEALKRFVLYCVRKLRENDLLNGINAQLSLNPIMME